MEADEIIKLVYLFADKNKFYDTYFIDSVHTFYQKNNFITDKQRKALLKSINDFNMVKWFNHEVMMGRI